MTDYIMRIFLCIFLVACLSGCGSQEPPSSQTALLQTSETESSPSLDGSSMPRESVPAVLASSSEDPQEGPPVSIADGTPEAEDPVIVVNAKPAPEMPIQAQDGIIQVSDDVYRDIVSRTLTTATGLKYGEPIIDGIEDVLSRSPDYLVDIQGMEMNLQRRDQFFENIKAAVPDNILVISLSENEDAPVMVESYHYGGAGAEYAVEQIYAENGKIVRLQENRTVSDGN